MKHGWGGMNGLVNLGLSRPRLGTLDSIGTGLDKIGGVGAAYYAAGTWKAGAGLSGIIDRARVEGIGASGALSAIPAAGANSNGALGKLSASLVSGRLKGTAGIGKFPLLTAAQDLELGKASRAYPALDALLGQAKGASPLYSVGKVSALAGAIPKPRALGIPRTMLGAEADLSAVRSAASFLGSGKRADNLLSSAWNFGGRDSLLSGLPKGILSGVYTRLPGLLGADAVRNMGVWRGVMPLSGTSWLFGPPRGLDLLGTQGLGLLHGTLPALDAYDAIRRASGWGLGGLLDTIGRIDLEALREDALREARVWEARQPRTRIGFAALDAYDELHMGHPWVADRFLLDYLGIQPNDDRREALWSVLRQAFERTLTYPARWIVLEEERAAAYLRAAVYNEADRVERDRERPDRVWWTARDPETKEKIELRPVLEPDDILELMMKRSGNPADIVVPPLDDRGWILEMLYLEGTEQDRRVVSMIIAGFDLAAIAHAVGWPEVQRFQRKAQRWRIKLDHPPGG
jgi:hypothetical protein